ncbi:MAG: hypothetical protein IJZ00_02085 [Lachnospiraceae bacterium]|nr:hypothetical protein [Lachnospiraceae bacterium]
MDINHVVYVTDEYYVMPTCVSIQSIIENNITNSQFLVHIIAVEISEESEKKIKKLSDKRVAISIQHVTEKYDGLYLNCLSNGIHVSKAALCKFDLPVILSDIDRVLYSDSDIIFNKDITPFFSVNIDTCYIAAVDDMGDEYTDGVSKLASRIGRDELRYFNSGIMYMNLEKMRKDDVSSKLKKYKKEGINFFVDQDSFNAVIGKDRISLSYQYNFRMPVINKYEPQEIGNIFFKKKYETVEDCIEDQMALHMTDKMKPWEYNIPWATDIFLKYYIKTAYSEEKLVLKSSLKEYVNKVDELYNSNTMLCNYLNKLKEIDEKKAWRIPFEKFNRGDKIILYGAGKVGQYYAKVLQKTEYCEIVLWVDENYKKIGNYISNPNYITNYEFDYVLLALANNSVINEVLVKLQNMQI